MREGRKRGEERGDKTWAIESLTPSVSSAAVNSLNLALLFRGKFHETPPKLRGVRAFALIHPDFCVRAVSMPVAASPSLEAFALRAPQAETAEIGERIRGRPLECDKSHPANCTFNRAHCEMSIARLSLCAYDYREQFGTLERCFRDPAERTLKIIIIVARILEDSLVPRILCGSI